MEAFEEIVKDQSQRIYYFLRRVGLEHEDADDILQDVFILLWRDLKSGNGLEAVELRLYQHATQKVVSFLKGNRDIPIEDKVIAAKIVFVLKNHEGFDFGDIAEMTGIAIGNVRSSFKATLDLRGL